MNERIKQLQRFLGVKDDGYLGNDTLTAFQKKYHIKNKASVSHFFGNVHHESLGFTASVENLNYTAVALLRIFPKYFKTLEEAKKFEKKPQKIANKVYGGRMYNNLDGDGWRYRGRGAIQLTGAINYILFSKWANIDVVSNPDLVSTDLYWQSAVWFFDKNGLFGLVNDVSDASIEKICRKINGGLNGLEDRINKVRYYNSMFK